MSVTAPRRPLAVLVFAQVLGGAGLAAGITVGALLAEDMLGSTGLAGVPSALFTGGAALGAVGIGRLSQRLGRRAGLLLGYGTGALGSLGVVAAAALHSLLVLFPALLIYGAGTATNLMARYAGAELVPPERRGRAVSTVLFATTLGAVAGPNLVTVTGDAAVAWGVPRLAGPFLLAAAAFGAAAAVLAVPQGAVGRPERGAAAGNTETGDRSGPGVQPLRPRGLAAGTAIMILTQLAMIALMTMTPVHLRAHGHGTQAAGLVIALHVGAMFLPSPLTGALVDRIGPYRVAAASGGTLLAAGLLAALAPSHSVPALAVALVLLGVGWNFGLVSGTALVTDALPPDRRAATQGLVDVGIALAGATGGAASGPVLAAGGFPVLALACGALALAVVPVAVLAARGAGDARRP
ncbi:MFS transporter [Streptomyces sp. NPDC093707]|uniref:MFS transporter n=1 Tax=Streptomyces sp. NPDC093707 TaxID=3154984 RepID=UPI00344B1B1C